MLLVLTGGYEQEIQVGWLFPRVEYWWHGARNLGWRFAFHLELRVVVRGWNRRDLDRQPRLRMDISNKEKKWQD